MLMLNRESLKDRKAWAEAGIELPVFDYGRVAANTAKGPAWVHFGAGNIFRGFIAPLQQALLNSGRADAGIVAVEGYDYEIIDKIYAPYDNLSLLVIMHPDGRLEKKVVGSITEGLVGDPSLAWDWQRLREIFANPSLQMASFTITEKGYSLKKMSGEYLDDVLADMENGPECPRHMMSKIASLAYERYQRGQYPIAFVSMDNCSHNGEKLQQSLGAIIERWTGNGLVESGFNEYINNPKIVSFPWSMIDKITPRPSETVKKALEASGFADAEIICTGKNTFIAPFVNAEGPQYLVIENSFPNGRPPLQSAGVIFTDRETVDKVEKMKVCTCLNPLHTSLAVFGCLLGYSLIADEMQDGHLKKLVEKIGYEEGLPVVVHPGIINPREFLREVIEQRFPNPYIPDTPQRIASDTSQKVGIRFGETIKAYRNRAGLDSGKLTFIPLAIAGWCRYLMGIDDYGQEMTISPDPLLNPLRSYLSEVRLGHTESIGDSLKPILANERIFGLNLYEAGIGEKIERYFAEMTVGKNAVRDTLARYLD